MMVSTFTTPRSDRLFNIMAGVYFSAPNFPSDTQFTFQLTPPLTPSTTCYFHSLLTPLPFLLSSFFIATQQATEPPVSMTTWAVVSHEEARLTRLAVHTWAVPASQHGTQHPAIWCHHIRPAGPHPGSGRVVSCWCEHDSPAPEPVHQLIQAELDESVVSL